MQVKEFEFMKRKKVPKSKRKKELMIYVDVNVAPGK